jgi:Flp pilus assembly protein TadB
MDAFTRNALIRRFRAWRQGCSVIAVRAGNTLERISALQLLLACIALALAITILPLAVLLFIVVLALKLGVTSVRNHSRKRRRLLTYDDGTKGSQR